MNTQSADSIFVVEKSIDELLECIQFCADGRALESYHRVLVDLKKYLLTEYKLEIKKANFAGDTEGAVILEMLLNRKLRKMELGQSH